MRLGKVNEQGEVIDDPDNPPKEGKIIQFPGKKEGEAENSGEDDIAVLETTAGSIEIKLYVKDMPITAGNFKKLVSEGFYDGTRFHRVIQNFMIQGGDPKSKNVALKMEWGKGGAATIKDEFPDNGHRNVRGTIAMANAGPDTGSSQFFINLADNNYLDWDDPQAPESKHPVFGEIINGMGVVDIIASTETGQLDIPVVDIIIRKAYMKNAGAGQAHMDKAA